MQNPHYALVAYVRHPAGDFVENVRKELHPELPLTPAHLTILPPRCLNGDSQSQAMSAFEVARERWTMYRGSRQIAVDHLTFVREGENNAWVDLAPIPLGRTLVSGQSY